LSRRGVAGVKGGRYALGVVLAQRRWDGRGPADHKDKCRLAEPSIRHGRATR
jgi:hypothetical protein